MELVSGQPSDRPPDEGLGKSSQEDSGPTAATIILLATAALLLLLFILTSFVRACTGNQYRSVCELCVVFVALVSELLTDRKPNKVCDAPPAPPAEELLDVEVGPSPTAPSVVGPGAQLRPSGSSVHPANLLIHTDRDSHTDRIAVKVRQDVSKAVGLYEGHALAVLAESSDSSNGDSEDNDSDDSDIRDVLRAIKMNRCRP